MAFTQNETQHQTAHTWIWFYEFLCFIRRFVHLTMKRTAQCVAAAAAATEWDIIVACNH